MTRPPLRGEDGTSTVEYVLITPALLLAVFTVVQVALVLFAQQAASLAARHAARTARTSQATSRVVVADTDRYLTRLAGDLTANRIVTVTRTQGTAQVTVSARVLPLVPGVTLTVTGRAAGPTERPGQATP
jgi:Flp pilus assembly protein TadG